VVFHFTFRAACHFANLVLLIRRVLNSWYCNTNATADRRFASFCMIMIGPGLGLLIITIYVCVRCGAIDWVMSLDHAWSSRFFGLIFRRFVESERAGVWDFSDVVAEQARTDEQVCAPPRIFTIGAILMMALVMLWITCLSNTCYVGR